MQETKHLHDVLRRYKARGGKLPGRVREIIADTLNTSTTQVGRLGAISKNLISEFQEEMRERRLGISAAYELSGLPEEQQKQAFAEYREKGGFTVDDVKQRKEPQRPAAPLPPPASPVPHVQAARQAHSPPPPFDEQPAAGVVESPRPAAERTERENTPEPEEYPETRCVDEGICPYCKARFDAAQAVNYSTQGTQGIGPVDCPHCGRPIKIFCCVEYLCSVPERGETE